MKAFVIGVVAAVVIACLAGLVATKIDQSSQTAYQAHDGSVRL